MIKSFFKAAWRNLGKSKVHSFINILGLSIGMAVAILIGLWIYNELSFDKSFRNHDRIALVVQNVTNNGEVQTWKQVPYPLADELRKNYGSDFKQVIMAVDVSDHILALDDKKLKQNGGYFERGAPEMLTLNMLRGNWNSLSDPASVLISESVAKAFFANNDPVNKVLKIDNSLTVKVSGVYKDLPRNSSFAGMNFMGTWEYYYNNSPWLKTLEDPWRPNFTSLYVQLNDNADIAAVSAKIKDAKLKKINAQLAKKKPALFLQSMNNWHLYSEFKNGVNAGGAIKYVWMFGIIGVFVLLLACINFMNLSTARSEKRSKEVGIRKTMGSGKTQLILQFFSESLVTVLFAFVFSLLLVQLILPFFNSVADKQMSILWSSPVFWIICAGFSLFTALIAGSYPAFYLSSFRPVKVLKGTFKVGRFAALPRKVLVVVQFTVSVVLIIGTIIVYKQIQFAKNRPVGYSRESLVSIPTIDTAIHSHFNAVKDELEQSGVITSVAESGSPTTAVWGSTSGISWRGKDPNLSVDFGTVNASYEYGKTVGWHLKEGRDFSRDFGTDTSAIILNETAVNFMGLQSPIGETLTWFGKPYSVIGVIDDMVMESPYASATPIIYSLNRGSGNVVIAKINPSVSASNALDKIQQVFKKFNPEQLFEYHFADDDYAKKFSSEERVGKLAGFFALLAVIISCLGLFGLSSFVAEQRTKEIGVRKVLGASILNLWKLLSKDFIALVFISFVIAAPIAWFGMNKWLLDYSYRITIGWEAFLLAGLLATLIALVTVSFQSIKAAIANPIKSLRTE